MLGSPTLDQFHQNLGYVVDISIFKDSNTRPRLRIMGPLYPTDCQRLGNHLGSQVTAHTQGHLQRWGPKSLERGCLVNKIPGDFAYIRVLEMELSC